MSHPVTITVETPDGETRELTAPAGSILRDVLLDAELSPHGRYARRLNCGGNGLCATCGVRLAEPPEPDHWHDDLAERFGYPRLSCQLRVREGMRVQLLDKRMWGSRQPDDTDVAPTHDEQR
ncbi:2Fe-2S iron-sulfur cluster-binding protein [Haloarcula salinisoli]|uniref:2Fe-2S iron-sulfur cluster binding domain-containing protein n=1 Tax=Haloarcula salinisoli TaxID=2487746 RepID=A0A8J8C859_9EURY|nr:2Fe-2S iron-sulfur cluster-binding protein [Halomicroarcula salinisoli]MBX0286691.1 2Fe-2S iron-sulfur cluster binding domain-containing protein [Halomicroarcula salinisoli]MBX0304002.1 2Fe-2S iron-sulfur cluster binding domain-containing protein [Halomicroarcula salinisoli]